MPMTAAKGAANGRGDGYLAAVARFPILAAEEELALARRWSEQGDQAALDRLVTSHLRLVAKIARRFRGYGMPVADIMSAGTVGLVRAAHGFDPERGFRFATYAAFWIRAEIQQYVLDNWSLVRISRKAANKRLFFSLRRVKSDLKVLEEGDLDAGMRHQIAGLLGVPEQSVAEMNARLQGGDLSLNVAAPGSDEEWQSGLADEGNDPEAALGEKEERLWRCALLGKALETLDERERHIVAERRLGDGRVTLDSLSQQYGISRERVRQLEARAFAKLRTQVAPERPAA
jgi:RNA polymerase sigma-32 factor